MRRNRMSGFQPVSRRSGVIVSVMQMNRRAHSPVSLVTSLRGLGLRLPVSVAQTSHAVGPSAAMKMAGLRIQRMAWLVVTGNFRLSIVDCRFTDPITRSIGNYQDRQSKIRLVVLLEIHPGVQARDLLAVAVEHQRLPPEELADAPFGGLGPARMVDRRVDVREKAVFLRDRFLPRVQRLLLDEADPDDRFRALEAILPRHDDAERRAVLLGH